ncbi:MAG: intradiol ring-cleavage dioxygenase [Deltaproteobacteria bacterium]|nr:intradiol ring-cleavage dioxygenase [Deltaproteobacteria bacterium]
MNHNAWLFILAVALTAFSVFAGGFYYPSLALAAEKSSSDKGAGFACPPTQPDQLGPMYAPGAPVRSKVGEGYVPTGVVKSAADCSVIPKARIEFWLVGPNAQYDDAHRATMFSDKNGAYRLESNFPPSYLYRPSHIHVKVTAPGHKTLVTQHYPVKGAKEATFDLVLIPAK